MLLTESIPKGIIFAMLYKSDNDTDSTSACVLQSKTADFFFTFYLCVLGIARLFHLVLPLLGEPNTEQPQEETICGLDIHMGLNQGLQSEQHIITL